ncbi:MULTISPECIES: ABC transporter substrate-binding protein [Saccharothrix]|uniref:ABC transporter substrate-binding protein n=1 Tax=Saccharothrix TaxID=2071 RepID=UPI00093AD851|nr:extracellular solute-binding protein [Saccharothrix sp. CB00851]OKI35310.1 bicyclomycin resistance protein [Saccharothrix sp. CB00851]
MTGRGLRVLAAAVPVALVLSACGSGDSGGGADGPLVFWTIEDTADRVRAQERLLAAFTEQTGIETKVVAVAENQLTTVLTSAAASGELPDVIGSISLPIMSQLRTDDLLDTDAAKQIVDGLGAETFAAQSLELTREGDTQLVVPSDGWAQLLFYRKDLFAQAGLPPPTTYDAIRRAAERLDQGDVAGIAASTTPADVFTHQTFEHLALANGCALVGDDGQVALHSPECVGAFQFYTDLVGEHSTAGNQDVDTTRATYFAGRSAMVIWSSYLLDELAGLRADALPTCPECQADPSFLAKNTGVVAALSGPAGGEPTTFGETASFAVLKDAATEDAKKLVEHLMTDGYRDWLAIAPEGKVPVRAGTKDYPRQYVEMWRGLDVGVDTKAPLSKFYDAETLRVVQESPRSFSRWGFTEGKAELAGAVAGQLVVPKALADVLNGGGDAAGAAREASEQAAVIAQELGE